MVLRYGYDLTYDEIAAALDSSPAAARRAASAGVRRLREEQPMTVPTELDTRFRDAAACPPSRRGIRHRGLPARAPSRRGDRSRPPPRLLRRRAGAAARGSRPRRGRGSFVLRARSTRCVANWTSTSRVVDARSISRSTPRSGAVHAGRARAARARATATYGELAALVGRPKAARRRDGDEPQPRADRASVPPCRGCVGQPRRLRRRTRAQGATAAPGRSVAVGPALVVNGHWRFVIPAAGSPRPRH